jgi:hypothetical protein
MKTTDVAIDFVYALISASSTIDCPLFKLVKPTKEKLSEYIVINSLPINAGVMQKTYVNVNYHVADKGPGVPDYEKLQQGTAALKALLETVSTTGLLIDFESQEYHSEAQLKEHYSNIRLNVKLIN